MLCKKCGRYGHIGKNCKYVMEGAASPVQEEGSMGNGGATTMQAGGDSTQPNPKPNNQIENADNQGWGELHGDWIEVIKGKKIPHGPRMFKGEQQKVWASGRYNNKQDPWQNKFDLFNEKGKGRIFGEAETDIPGATFKTGATVESNDKIWVRKKKTSQR